MNTAIIPVAKEEDDVPWQSSSSWWIDLHKNHIAESAKKQDVKYIFIGDSITQQWLTQPVWEKSFANSALNLGIGGDQTCHLLWRLENNPNLKNVNPESVIILIGTNNIGHNENTPEETVEGIVKISETVTDIFPKSNQILLSVLPRGENKEDSYRIKVNEINDLLQKQNFNSEQIDLLNIGNIFLEKDLTIKKEIMHDYLHLTEEGYNRFANSLIKHLGMFQITLEK